MSLRDVILERIRVDGPMPFAEYMDLALYHPELGYYAGAAKRSGSSGDFFTSVDLGPLYGELLATQFGEMWRLMASGAAPPGGCHLVEAGAGSGRLLRDVLEHARRADPAFYAAVRCTLVERSLVAREARASTLAHHGTKVESAQADVPADVHGIIFANELLDAFPVRPIAMTDRGLREVYVDRADARLVESLGPLSTAARQHVERFGIDLQPGWRAEVSPDAIAWVENAARQLTHGFLVLVDYGHDAATLYSPSHAAGTLAAYRRHRVESAAATDRSAPWLVEPGARDITAHVDLTAVRRAAEDAGLDTVASLDQTYFLLGLAAPTLDAMSAERAATDIATTRRRLALKTLLLPGGLGSSHKVLVFGRGVGRPTLRGCAFGERTT